MRTLVLFVIFLSFRAAVVGQPATPLSLDSAIFQKNDLTISPVRPDSSQVQVRSFDQQKLKELKDNNDFNYEEPPSVAESLWDRLLLWLGQFFAWIFRSAVETNWGKVFLYTLGLVVLAGIIMMLLKVDALRVFYSGADKGALRYETFQENIHEMDFEKLINDALVNKEYRHGVRLTFLFALKLLSDKHQVDWRPGKTNHDYLEELKPGALKTGFNELSFYFDYAWYGEFDVNENLYQRVRTIFENWRPTLS